MKKIKIAQIGMAHDHAADKILNLKALNNIYDIVGIFEPHQEVLKSKGQLKSFENVPIISLDDIIEDKSIDVVTIETDVPELDKYASICVDSGKHIHMDKPAGENFSEYVKMLNKAERNNLIVQMSYMYRFNPVIEYALDTARSGKIGKIWSIDTQMSTLHSEEYRKRYGFSKGGAMYIFGCHLIDLIVRIMGEPEKVTPYNRATCTGEIADNCFAVLEYPDAVCSVRTSSLEVDGFRRRELVIRGTEGTIAVQPLEKPSTLHMSLKGSNCNLYNDISNSINIPTPELRHIREFEILAKMIRGEIENPYSYNHDIAVHKATLLACGINVD